VLGQSLQQLTRVGRLSAEEFGDVVVLHSAQHFANAGGKLEALGDGEAVDTVLLQDLISELGTHTLVVASASSSVAANTTRWKVQVSAVFCSVV
jgi:hypothetical protein